MAANDERDLSSYTREFAVRCPRCARKAVAHMVGVGVKGTYREPFVKFGVKQFTCVHCGYARKVAAGSEDKFEYWYVTEFEGRRVWADSRLYLDRLIHWFSCNKRWHTLYRPHAAYLEALPKWLRAGKNRSAVLKRLRQLRDRVEG